MISKLAKAHESWAFKIISLAVAVSFISLFGVTGYINTASQNQTVIKVGKRKIPQSEVSYRVQKELSALKNLTGDDFEITDELRSSITESVLKQLVDENVMDLTMQREGIYFPKAFVQQVVFSQPEFRNPVNGQFNPDIFRRALSSAGMSEDEYVASVKRMMGRKMLVTDLLTGFNVPNVLTNAIHKMDNQRKLFKYVVLSPEDMVIERKISDDEIGQYFEDFAEQFIIPEKRNVDVLYISNDVILDKLAANEETIRDYFTQHKKELDQPEKREVLQMVFTDKDTAEKAFADVQKGESFGTVAETYKAENASEPTLGVVSEDELADELAYSAFKLEAGKPELLQVADTWQVIRVEKVIPAKEATYEESKDAIAELLKDENMYDVIKEASNLIDDAINAGQSLEEAGKQFGAQVVSVAQVSEDALVKNAPAALKDLTSSLDFNEFVFSYVLDETSLTKEFDDGIAAIRITAIEEEHMPEINDIRDEITALWTVQEKNALAKELSENIVNDAEDGTQLADAAKARNLEVYRSEPISRNETFADLTPAEITDLFLSENGDVKVYEHAGNRFIVASPFESVNYADEMDEEEFKTVKQRAAYSMMQDMNQSTLDAYAEKFKIKIDYQMAGFSE